MTGWQPPQYDPSAHQQRIHGQPPPRKRSRAPLYAGIAAAAVLAAGGGAAYALAGGSAPAKPLTCKQQYAAWKTGPARDLAKRTFGPDADALQSAADAEDIPELNAALKQLGADAVRLQAYPMPACADPAGYWPRILTALKAAGDNAGVSSGLGGMLLAISPLKDAQPLEAKLGAELTRTTGT